MRYATSGRNNTALGQVALGVLTEGNDNTALGMRAGDSVTTGSNNIALGYHAGDNITTGSNNIMIGYDIDAADPAGDDQLNIGDTIFGDLSTGRVGIGTSAPISPLHISKDMPFDGTMLTLTNTADSGSFNTINMDVTGGDRDVGMTFSNQSVRQWTLMKDGNQTPNNSFVLRLCSRCTHLLQVQQNGNVGLWTTTPSL